MCARLSTGVVRMGLQRHEGMGSIIMAMHPCCPAHAEQADGDPCCGVGCLDHRISKTTPSMKCYIASPTLPHEGPCMSVR